MSYRVRFSERWTPAVIILGVVGMILDFHYGGDIILENFLNIMLFVGRAALTGWLAIAVIMFLVVEKFFLSRRGS